MSEAPLLFLAKKNDKYSFVTPFHELIRVMTGKVGIGKFVDLDSAGWASHAKMVADD